MSLVHEEGILLRSHPYSESSRILRFLTASHGVLSVMARGVRKDSSRGRGGADTFDTFTVSLNHRAGRDLHTLRDLETHRSRRGLGRDVLRFAGASLLAEILLAHTLEEENPGLYLDFGGALDALERVEREVAPGLVVAAGWGLLVHAGFPPELDRCVACGRSAPAEGLATFDGSRGGIVCPRCAPPERGRGVRLGPQARRDLRSLVRGEPVRDLPGAVTHLGMLERYAVHHFGLRRAFRSTGLLRGLLEEGTAKSAPDSRSSRSQRA